MSEMQRVDPHTYMSLGKDNTNPQTLITSNNEPQHSYDYPVYHTNLPYQHATTFTNPQFSNQSNPNVSQLTSINPYPTQGINPNMAQVGSPSNPVFIVNTPGAPAENKKTVHFDLAITLSVFVCLLFNFPFGCIAFILSISGLYNRSEVSIKKTENLLRASYIVSIVGVLLSVFIWLVTMTIIIIIRFDSTQYGGSSPYGGSIPYGK